MANLYNRNASYKYSTVCCTLLLFILGFLHLPHSALLYQIGFAMLRNWSNIVKPGLHTTFYTSYEIECCCKFFLSTINLSFANVRAYPKNEENLVRLDVDC